MQDRLREQICSPQFKDTESPTHEQRKYSSISGIELTPETKYRSTITPHRNYYSNHFRHKTCDDEQFKIYEEIKELYSRRQFDQPTHMEPKILFMTEEFPTKFRIKRKPTSSVFNDQQLIDKMYRANQASYNSLLSI